MAIESRGPNQILFTRNAEIRFDANGNGIRLKRMVALELDKLCIIGISPLLGIFIGYIWIYLLDPHIVGIFIGYIPFQRAPWVKQLGATSIFPMIVMKGSQGEGGEQGKKPYIPTV